MTWNYRILKRNHKKEPNCFDGGSDDTKDSDINYYTIHEVYYNNKGDIETWSTDSIHPYGNTLEELKEELKQFQQAFNEPILDAEELEKIITIYELSMFSNDLIGGSLNENDNDEYSFKKIFKLKED